MKIACTLLTICLALAVNAQPLKPARVSSVTDGETVKLIIGQDIVKVRLDSIGAPEKRQAGGKESRQALRALLPNGSQVRLLSKGEDRYHPLSSTPGSAWSKWLNFPRTCSSRRTNISSQI